MKVAIKYRAVKIQWPVSGILYNLLTFIKKCGKPCALFLKIQDVGAFFKDKKVHKNGP
jgi:hypothetical protein